MSISSVAEALEILTGKADRPKKRDCQLCEADKAVGKYYLTPDESENHGWWRVCSDCAEMVSRVGAQVQYYKYSKEHKEQLPDAVMACSHEWEKWSLVGEVDKHRNLVFDWMRCNKCRCYGKRFSLDQTKMDDLSMEIDLSCSR
jgi:hypothetical protein